MIYSFENMDRNANRELDNQFLDEVLKLNNLTIFKLIHNSTEQTKELEELKTKYFNQLFNKYGLVQFEVRYSLK